MKRIIIIFFVLLVCCAAYGASTLTSYKTHPTQKGALETLAVSIPLSASDSGITYDLPVEFRGLWLEQVELMTSGDTSVSIRVYNGYGNVLYAGDTAVGSMIDYPSDVSFIPEKKGATFKMDGMSTGTGELQLTGSR